MNAWMRDTLERVVFTYLESLIGLLIASGTGLVTLGGVKAAAVAAIPAALTVAKSALAARVPGTVSPASVARDPDVTTAAQVFQEL